MSNYKEKRTQKLAERTGIVDVNASGASGASKESLFIKALGSNDFITRDKVIHPLPPTCRAAETHILKLPPSALLYMYDIVTFFGSSEDWA